MQRMLALLQFTARSSQRPDAAFNGVISLFRLGCLLLTLFDRRRVVAPACCNDSISRWRASTPCTWLSGAWNSTLCAPTKWPCGVTSQAPAGNLPRSFMPSPNCLAYTPDNQSATTGASLLVLTIHIVHQRRQSGCVAAAPLRAPSAAYTASLPGGALSHPAASSRHGNASALMRSRNTASSASSQPSSMRMDCHRRGGFQLVLCQPCFQVLVVVQSAPAIVSAHANAPPSAPVAVPVPAPHRAGCGVPHRPAATVPASGPTVAAVLPAPSPVPASLLLRCCQRPVSGRGRLSCSSIKRERRASSCCTLRWMCSRCVSASCSCCCNQQLFALHAL